MLTFKEALKIVESKLSKGFSIYPAYGEIQDKYVFSMQNSNNMIPPSGGHWTVHKETGECKFEYLEREKTERGYHKPYAPIKGYKKIDPNQID